MKAAFEEEATETENPQLLLTAAVSSSKNLLTKPTK